MPTVIAGNTDHCVLTVGKAHRCENTDAQQDGFPYAQQMCGWGNQDLFFLQPVETWKIALVYGKHNTDLQENQRFSNPDSQTREHKDVYFFYPKN